jgi:hypothetical protein
MASDFSVRGGCCDAIAFKRARRSPASDAAFRSGPGAELIRPTSAEGDRDGAFDCANAVVAGMRQIVHAKTPTTALISIATSFHLRWNARRERVGTELRSDELDSQRSSWLLDPSPQLQDLLPQFRVCEVVSLRTDHDVRGRNEPPRAVERGTPRAVAIAVFPVRWTSSRRRWSWRCCRRDLVVMPLIIGRRLTDLNCQRKRCSVGVRQLA